MGTILTAAPGQTVTIVFENLNSIGTRQDGYDGLSTSVPTVERIIFPNYSLASGYPQQMTRLDVGLYVFKFTLPISATAVGTYIVDILYEDPDIIGHDAQTLVQVVVTAPFGNYTASTF